MWCGIAWQKIKSQEVGIDFQQARDKQLIPRHAAVDSKVDWVGQTDDYVDEQDNIGHQDVVQEVLTHAEIKRFLQEQQADVLLFTTGSKIFPTKQIV